MRAICITSTKEQCSMAKWNTHMQAHTHIHMNMVIPGLTNTYVWIYSGFQRLMLLFREKQYYWEFRIKHFPVIWPIFSKLCLSRELSWNFLLDMVSTVTSFHFIYKMSNIAFYTLVFIPINIDTFTILVKLIFIHPLKKKFCHVL